MACLPSQTCNELEFVSALLSRAHGQCRGPLMRFAFGPYRVFALEHIMDSAVASDVLWDGFQGEGPDGVHFELCAAHWVDLAALCELRSLQYRRVDWHETAESLMDKLCASAGWDPKEISNMIAWKSERLT